MRDTFNLKDENGAVIIEATISLSVFMFFIVTLLSIINICYAQAKIGAALNESAKELSEYSYMYAISRLNQEQAELYGNGQEAQSTIDKGIESIGNMYDALEGGTQSVQNNDIEKITDYVNQGSSAVTQLNEVFDKISGNPKQFAIGVASIFGNKIIEEGKSKIIAPVLSRCLMKRHLKASDSDNTEDFLKRLRVVPAANGKYIDGIKFSDSLLFENGTQHIKLVAEYEIKVIPLLPVDMKFKFKQSAETDGWGGVE